MPKHSRSFGKMDEQIIAMYARGMSTRDIQAFIDNLYGVDISPDYVSKVTDRVLEDVRECRIARSQVCIPSLSSTPFESKSAAAQP